MNLEECQVYLKNRLDELLSANAISKFILNNNLVENANDFNLELNSFIKNNISIMNKEFKNIKIENKLYDIKGNNKLIKKITKESLDVANKRIDSLMDDYSAFKLIKVISAKTKSFV